MMEPLNLAQAPGELPASRLANVAATAIADAFFRHHDSFTAITRRAKGRFEARDWKGAIADAAERLDLYGAVIAEIEHEVRITLAQRVEDKMVWAGMKAVYSSLIADRADFELGETFFNSVTRRIFATVGVDPDIEYVNSDFEARGFTGPPFVRVYHAQGSVAGLLRAALMDMGFEAPFRDLERDLALASARIQDELAGMGEVAVDLRLEVVAAPFFRRKGAYVLGLLDGGSATAPLALALLHNDGGIVIDAVLMDENDISILFSFTRSHFHVDLEPPRRLVQYIKRLLPRKSLAEIYIALGYHKHGKTELFRDLLRHLRTTDGKFDVAPGTPGMVMVVFTLEGYDVVFKVIRDRFPAIKPVTPQSVKDCYRLVFRHDRAGRLVEAQDFEHLEFDRERFEPRLLEEFRRDADRTVEITDDQVVVHHAYIERRVTPLDVFLASAPPERGLEAVEDFGQAISELAASNIFPGELLPKNFGLTRHSRVVCYDYDELSLLTDFTFRSMPESTSDDDEFGDEAWFGVGPRDVFPSEFGRFLQLPGGLTPVFHERHPEIADLAFWIEVQERVRSGEIIDIYPYPANRRLNGPAKPNA